MIDEKLYRETFSRLRASDEAKKEVFHKMETQKRIRFLKLLRGAAIAAAVAMALAVTAGAVNAATDGMLLDGTLLHIIFFADNRMELTDGEGNSFSVIAADGHLVREENGRVYVQSDDGEADITGELAETGAYAFQHEVAVSTVGGSTVTQVIAVEITGVPGDLIVSEKTVGGSEDPGYALCYSIRNGDVVSGTDDPETFAAVTEAAAAD